MTPALLLDASVWLAALDVNDTNHAAATELIASAADGSRRLAALDLTLYEVANVASVRWRSAASVPRLIDLVELSCAEGLVRIDRDLAVDAGRVATENRLTAYDAAYVAAARANDWTLVSGDVADLVKPGFARAPDSVLT